ncbi:MAG: 1-acyl-sn-glycerol-3-phosphate acyltransferase [Saprospiraceae bacterium]|nr:1-acyl-sn-glycerol-3-phosphate acyltransferase [Saprospiraceae bacterium]
MKHSLLYLILRPLVRLAVGVYFRNLHIIDAHHVPDTGPLLIASNHPNSFAEPVILATFQKRILYYLVRGDVFKNPVFAWVLRMTHQLPIYRFKDGYADMKRNDESFSACFEHLRRGNSIVIYAEGGCVFEKRLRPIKKGAARIVLGALDKFPEIPEIKILPVAVNYPHGDQYRSQAMVHFGEPIAVRDYWQTYTEQPQVAINQITQEIENRLSPLVLQIKDMGRDKLYDDVMDIWHGGTPVPVWPIILENPNRFQAEKKLSNFINDLDATAYLELNNDINKIRTGLEGVGIRNWSKLYLKRSGPFLSLILQVLLTIPSVLGIILNVIPFYAAKAIGSKIKKMIEYYTPVRMGAMFFIAVFQNAILAGLIIAGESWTCLVLLMLYPIWSWLAAFWIENWEGIFIRFKFNQLNAELKSKYHQIQAKLLEIAK